MIENKFTTEFSVYRPTWSIKMIEDEVIDVNEEELAGTFNGYIQQATADYIQSLGLTMTKPHIVWCGVETDVVSGDVIKADGVYSVRAKQINNDGVNAHCELIVEQTSEDAPDESS